MLKFETLESLLPQDGKKLQIENRTMSRPAMRAHRLEDDTIALRSGRYDIVLLHRDGSYTIRPNSTLTFTDKRRIMEATGFEVVYLGSDMFDLLTPSGWKKFCNAIRIDSNGKIVSNP